LDVTVSTRPRRLLTKVLTDGYQQHGDLRLHFRGVDGEQSATLAQLWAEAQRLAAQLRTLGVGPGDVVAFQISAWRPAAVVFYAAILAEATVLPVVYVFGAAEFEWALTDSQAAVVVTSPEAADKLRPLVDRVPTLRALLVVETDEGQVELTVAARGHGAPAVRRPAAPDPLDQTAILLYTSGTESLPKGVRHTHRTILGEVDPPVGSRPCGQSVAADEVILYTGPLGHIGSVAYLLFPWAHGRPVIYLNRWNAAVAAAACREHRVTYTHGPPIVVESLLEQIAASRPAYAALRCIRIGGASVQPALVERLDSEFGIKGYRTYGSTEHPTTASGWETEPLLARSTTDGRPLPGNRVRIVDVSGADLPAGEPGEIWTTGAERFAGYNNPELDVTALRGDWYRTGDIGVLDDTGRLAVTGRLKDIIVRGGENISADRVAGTLLQHAAIAEAAVLGVPDARYGERVAAFIVLSPGASEDQVDLGEHFARLGVSRHYLPERFDVVAELPRNAMGKVRREALRRRAAELWPEHSKGT
jgi:acyl-CoA synthetase (AMP-forming)/AMP-acid ligase II